MTDTPQLKAALKWIERGFIPYPAKGDSKSEFSRKSERYHQRAKLNAEWATWAWSGRFAASNVKIKPAPNTCIVDVDREGFESANAIGFLAAITYTETTPDGGYRLVFTLPDGFGAGIGYFVHVPGVELFCEASNNGVMVAPSVTAKGEYVALDESFTPCPAPQCVLDAIAAARAKRERPKRDTLPDVAQPEAPKTTQRRYAETALFRECARLKSIPAHSGNGRHEKLRDACVRVGSVLHLGLTQSEAETAIEQVVSHWTDRNQNDDARTIRDGLAHGERSPRNIEWKHAERDFDDGTKAIADYLAAAKRNGKIGRVTTATAHAVLGAMVAHSTERHLFGAFVLSVRQIAEMIGSGRKTVCNAIHSLASMRILQKLDRAEVSYIKRCNPDGEILRPQQMANCYAFRPLTVLGMMQGEACRKGTVIAYEREGDITSEFDLPSHSPLTVPFLHTLECSRTALGRSCAAVLVAIGNGANTRAALAHSTGLHPSTIKRAIVCLLTFGMVIHDESTHEYFMVDAEQLQQALQIVRSDYSIGARALARATRHTKERNLQAEWLKWREARAAKNEPRSYADFKESRQPFNVGSASAALPALRQQLNESKRIRERLALAEADYVRAMQSTTK